MKMTAFWDVAPCSLIALTAETVRTSEKLDYFHETIRRYIPESCLLHTCSHENLKSHKEKYVSV
jgi:hypothetical protein